MRVPARKPAGCLKRKIIVLDHVLFGERQFSLPFVMAHEVAHWLLHSDCDITAIKEREQFPDDDDETEDTVLICQP